MWYDLETHRLIETPAQAWAARPNTSPAPVLGDDLAESLALLPVAPTAPPPHDPATQRLVMGAAPTEAGMVQTWQVQDIYATEVDAEAARAAHLSAARDSAIARIDADDAAIYRALYGERATEYARAEQQARDYVAANYSGPAPSCVASWAAAKGCTDQDAADGILSAAAACRATEDQIRAARLTHKEQVRQASTEQGIEAVLAAWALWFNGMRAELVGVI